MQPRQFTEISGSMLYTSCSQTLLKGQGLQLDLVPQATMAFLFVDYTEIRWRQPHDIDLRIILYIWVNSPLYVSSCAFSHILRLLHTLTPQNCSWIEGHEMHDFLSLPLKLFCTIYKVVFIHQHLMIVRELKETEMHDFLSLPLKCFILCIRCWT